MGDLNPKLLVESYVGQKGRIEIVQNTSIYGNVVMRMQ